MRLEGAHDSRAVNRRARGAETRRPRASGGLCRAWGSLLQGLPPNPMVARGPARAVDPDSSRRARTRGLMDTSHLRILRNPHKQTKKQTASLLRPVLAPTGRAKPKIPCTLSNYSLLRLRKKLRA